MTDSFQNKDTLQNQKKINKLESVLCYTFVDKTLLNTAINHSSAVKNRIQSNERLEFLGDRVLGMVIAKMLYLQFPDEKEGDLGYRFTSLVQTQSLARIAENLSLAEYINFPEGTLELSSQKRTNILSNTCEAIIAAIYLDGGYELASDFVTAHWQVLIDEDLIPKKDAKTKLQEWAQQNGFPLPHYFVVNQSGPDHKPEFTVEARIDCEGLLPSKASGPTKRAAETRAAEILLNTIKVSEGV